MLFMQGRDRWEVSASSSVTLCGTHHVVQAAAVVAWRVWIQAASLSLGWQLQSGQGGTSSFCPKNASCCTSRCMACASTHTPIWQRLSSSLLKRQQQQQRPALSGLCPSLTQQCNNSIAPSADQGATGTHVPGVQN